MKKLSFKGDKSSDSKKRKRAHDSGTRDSSNSALPTARPTGKVSHEDGNEDDDKHGWCSATCNEDVQGPIVICIAHTAGASPSAISSDERGSVFTIPCSQAPDDLSTDTVEPHDVRQVFVATTPPNYSRSSITTTATRRPTSAVTEQSDSEQPATSDSEVYVTLKNSGGKYLSSDRFGAISASRDAISPSEIFTLTCTGGGWFSFKTVYGMFLSVQPTEQPTGQNQTAQEADTGTGIGEFSEGSNGHGHDGTGHGNGRRAEECRGDATSNNFNECFRIRIQRRFKSHTATTTPHAAGSSGSGAVASSSSGSSKAQLEKMVGRKLTTDEVTALRRRERRGEVHEAVLDLRVQGRSDKFG